MSWFENVPLWSIWIVIMIALMGACEAGYRIHRLALGRVETGRDDGTGYLLSAALGLLWPLIAFTFSMAGERYDARRRSWSRKPNAIGTTYLRIQLLQDPERPALSRMMLAYVQAREEFIVAGRDRAAIERADADTGTSEQELWRVLIPVLAAQPE